MAAPQSPSRRPPAGEEPEAARPPGPAGRVRAGRRSFPPPHSPPPGKTKPSSSIAVAVVLHPAPASRPWRGDVERLGADDQRHDDELRSERRDRHRLRLERDRLGRPVRRQKERRLAQYCPAAACGADAEGYVPSGATLAADSPRSPAPGRASRLRGVRPGGRRHSSARARATWTTQRARKIAWLPLTTAWARGSPRASRARASRSRRRRT